MASLNQRPNKATYIKFENRCKCNSNQRAAQVQAPKCCNAAMVQKRSKAPSSCPVSKKHQNLSNNSLCTECRTSSSTFFFLCFFPYRQAITVLVPERLSGSRRNLRTNHGQTKQAYEKTSAAPAVQVLFSFFCVFFC